MAACSMTVRKAQTWFGFARQCPVSRTPPESRGCVALTYVCNFSGTEGECLCTVVVSGTPAAFAGRPQHTLRGSGGGRGGGTRASLGELDLLERQETRCLRCQVLVGSVEAENGWVIVGHPLCRGVSLMNRAVCVGCHRL